MKTSKEYNLKSCKTHKKKDEEECNIKMPKIAFKTISANNEQQINVEPLFVHSLLLLYFAVAGTSTLYILRS